jgi:hypothetical protein
MTMPQAEAPATSFADATAIVSLSGSAASVAVAADWGYRGHPNGGYLLATLLRATAAVTGRDDIVTASCQFVRSPQPGPASVLVETVRAGRRVAQLRAVMVQAGATVLEAIVTCPPRPAPPGPRPGAPVPLPDIAACLRVEPRGAADGIAHRVHVHYDPETAPRYPLRSDGPARIGGWVTLADGAAPDWYAAVLAADALPPTVRNRGVAGWTPTLHSTVTFRADPAPGPLAVIQTARQIDADLFDEDIEVLDNRGVLVLQARQVSIVQNSSRTKAGN